jgi:hypothetical protein
LSFGAQRGHVKRVGDAAVDEEVSHLLGDLEGDVDLGFRGRGAKVRGADEVRRAEQRAVLGRLGLEHVERGAGDLACVHRFLERCLVDQAAAGAVDDPHALLGLGEVFLRQDVAGLVGERGVEGDEVRPRQQVVQFHLLHAHFHRALGREERIEGDDLHAQADGAGRDDRADVAGADQAEGLARHFHAHEAVLRPQARLGLGIGLGDLAREGEHHGDGVFGGGDRVAERGVHHHHALGRGVGDIDVVDADAGAADHLEPGGGVDDFLGDLGRRADGEAVVFADTGDQLLRRFAGDDIDVAAHLGEDAGGVGIHLVGNENLGLGHGMHSIAPFPFALRSEDAVRASRRVLRDGASAIRLQRLLRTNGGD